LTLINFDAKKVNNYTQVTWKTDNEQNVDHFTVDRSDNGTQFYAIAQLPARNSGNLELYSFLDKKPVSSQAFYRLKCADIDGRIKFSSVVKVTATQKIGDLALLTNPVKEKLILVPGNNLEGEFQYSIFTNSGQIVQQGKTMIYQREHAQLPLKTSIKPGTYILTLKSSKHSLQIKFIVQ
jgi:hypothetical protein